MTDHSTVASAEAGWRAFTRTVQQEHRAFFDGSGDITGARAPGRIDVAGGVVDYSGGTVLEIPLAEAAHAAVQARPDGLLRLKSTEARREGMREEVEIPLSDLLSGGLPRPFEAVAAALREPADRRWTGYVAGGLYVLAASGWLEAGRVTGLNILVESAVPIGAGVSSSAALEVATMTALCAHFDLQAGGEEIARLCQIVENRVVGAPCGIMDQVTAALGRANNLLILKCQPHDVLGHQPIPPDWRFVGIDSHVKHSVGGRNYTRARVAAFMGLKILQTESGDPWDGYLCNASPVAWKPWRERIPETLTGADFTARYGDLPDPMTKVDPAETYRIRACAEHHILENDRVRELLALMQLAKADHDEQLLGEAGELMLAANAGYSERLLLGSPETDLLVALAMERGRERGLFGAKVTGGGSGGTVVILCAGPQADRAIAEVRDEYARRTGNYPRLMTGSSPGAIAFGARRIA